MLGLKRNEVKIVEYDPSWKEEFERVKQQIIHETGISSTRIEHIRSTSIKELSAKPLLDIMIGVDEVGEGAEKFKQAFKQVGFLELAVQLEEERIFAKFAEKTNEKKTHVMHLVEYKGEKWIDLLFFKGYVQAHEEVKKEYEQLKKQAEKEFSVDIEAYTDAKERFVSRILKKRPRTDR